VRLLLFDLDGTLVLTGGAGMRALERAFEKRNGRRESVVAMQVTGRTDPKIVRDLYVRHLGVDPDEHETNAFLADYLTFLEEEVASSTGYHLLPGIPGVLDELAAAGYVLGLATGNVRQGARLKLTRGDLWRRFSFGGFGDDAADRGEMVRIAASRSPRRFAPEDTWIIGDTPLDIAAARAAGFPVLAVATGTHSLAQLEEARPDILLPTLERLTEVL